MTTNTTPAVYGAIAAVQGELAKVGIAKDGKNEQQKYRFRGIDAVYNALAPLLAKHGLCVIPRMIEREVTEHASKSGGVLFYVCVRAEFDFVAASDGSAHTAATFGEAMDSGDKATNKAMSAAYKYAAFMTFAIPTEGDNDADAVTHEVEAREGPAARAKLTGQHTSGTALKAAMHKLIAEVDAARSIEELDAIMTSAAPTLAQCREHYPSWLDGDPEKPEFVGFAQREYDKRIALSPTLELAALLNDMRANTSLQALTAWQMDGANLARADALDDTECARFNDAMIEYERGLTTVAVANT